MIVEWSKPVDIHYLSSRLFVFQVGIVCFLAPFIYLLQGRTIHLALLRVQLLHEICVGWRTRSLYLLFFITCSTNRLLKRIGLLPFQLYFKQHWGWLFLFLGFRSNWRHLLRLKILGMQLQLLPCTDIRAVQCSCSRMH